jgi:hypothetical protein
MDDLIVSDGPNLSDRRLNTSSLATISSPLHWSFLINLSQVPQARFKEHIKIAFENSKISIMNWVQSFEMFNTRPPTR